MLKFDVIIICKIFLFLTVEAKVWVHLALSIALDIFRSKFERSTLHYGSDNRRAETSYPPAPEYSSFQ